MGGMARSLRGGCHCGRNSYIIDVPPATTSNDANAQVLFNSDSLHVSPLAAPLSAFLRVPLSWYRSSTHAFFEDETHAMIRRVFESSDAGQGPTKRHFCGFCGTPLSFWTERPLSEADFIQLTLATLCDDDLGDLDDMGLLPRSPAEASPEGTEAETDHVVSVAQDVPQTWTRVVRGVPWLDDLVEGSRLAKVRRAQGAGQSADGSSRTEWEIIEWTEEDDERSRADASRKADEMTSSLGKRKMADRSGSALVSSADDDASA